MPSLTLNPVNRRLAAERRLLGELEEYRGRWVAIRDSHVVANASSFEELRLLVAIEDLDTFFEVEPALA